MHPIRVTAAGLQALPPAPGRCFSRHSYGADSRNRTGGLDHGKVALYHLSYVRGSGGGSNCPPPPEDHIPELLRSNWSAAVGAGPSQDNCASRGGLSRSDRGPNSLRQPPTQRAGFIWWGVQVTILASRSIGFTDRAASLAEYHPKFFQLQGPKSKEPGLLSLIRAPLSGTVISSITQDDYMVILPDRLPSFSQPCPYGRLGSPMPARDKFMGFSAPWAAIHAKRPDGPNRPVLCCCAFAVR